MTTERFVPPTGEPVGDAGRDPLTGHVLPHKRDELVAGKVEAMTALGLTVEAIAIELDLRPGQIREHYSREIEVATVRAHAQVAKAVFDMASKPGNLPASKYWLENRAPESWTKDSEKAPTTVIVEVRQFGPPADAT